LGTDPTRRPFEKATETEEKTEASPRKKTAERALGRKELTSGLMRGKKKSQPERWRQKKKPPTHGKRGGKARERGEIIRGRASGGPIANNGGGPILERKGLRTIKGEPKSLGKKQIENTITATSHKTPRA